ncbi:MAG: NUDIX domain-containing protein [Phycisphaerales bacterium]|nr:NUDIX domain-containing protein [Phycisphaerales bacterium]
MGSKHHTEIIARGLLIHNGRVLMCRNIKHNYCYLPGGHVEFAEKASDALIREIKEETGLESSVGPLLLTTEQCFNDGKRVHHEINVVFHVEHIGESTVPNSNPPSEVPSIESYIDFAWVDLAQLPEADIRPNEIKAWLMSGGATTPSQGPWLTGFEHETRG